MTEPIRIEERSVVEVLGGIGSYTVLRERPAVVIGRCTRCPPARVIVVKSMELDHLESLVSSEPDSETVVGLGGGSAIDTAKFVA
jgi:glycerol dehydrogenase-like iron-containing ADH family enzyme